MKDLLDGEVLMMSFLILCETFITQSGTGTLILHQSSVRQEADTKYSFYYSNVRFFCHASARLETSWTT